MILEFSVTVDMSDYERLGGDDIMETLWTHQKAVEWLDDRGYLNDVLKYIDYREGTVKLSLRYKLTKRDLTMLLLFYPNIYKTHTPYEIVNVYDTE